MVWFECEGLEEERKKEPRLLLQKERGGGDPGLRLDWQRNKNVRACERDGTENRPGGKEASAMVRSYHVLITLPVCLLRRGTGGRPRPLSAVSARKYDYANTGKETKKHTRLPLVGER